RRTVGNADGLAVQGGALAARGEEELAAERIEGGGGGETGGVLGGHVHREVRDAVSVVGGAVERIDVETQRRFGVAARASLLGQHRRRGESRSQITHHRRLARL